MFQYKIDVLGALKAAGYNTTTIRNEKLLSESALQYIRDRKVVGIKTLEQICSLLQCQPGDIIEWISDND